MKATEILMSEHRIIERVITAVENGAQRLESGQPIRPEFFLDASDFIKGFADGCHHKKEEGVLFKTMEQAGIPVEGGPIGMMLYEHEQGRAFTAGMRRAALRLQSGDASAASAVAENAHGYAQLLRQHIQKEDTILFPMADQFVPPSHQDQVLDGFEHVEHEETGAGVHEKYLALAERLEAELQ
jgi:hemerythrin-like domain-containing protein